MANGLRLVFRRMVGGEGACEIWQILQVSERTHQKSIY